MLIKLSHIRHFLSFAVFTLILCGIFVMTDTLMLLLSLMLDASCLAPLLSSLVHSPSSCPGCITLSRRSPSPWDPCVVGQFGITHVPADPSHCESGEDAPHVSMCPCTAWPPSLAKPQPSAFKQKKMFFRN